MNSNSSLYIEEALSFIPADDRDTWLRMAMAIKSEIGEEGFDIWNKWSQQSDSYNSRDAKNVWRSIKSNGGVSIGTLFHEAKANGWHSKGKHDSLIENIKPKTLANQFTKTTDEQAHTASIASQIWNQATDVKPDHPYLKRKEVTAVRTMRELGVGQAEKILGYIPKSKGENLIGRLLVIPVKINKKLSTLELIDERGRKSALRGQGTKSGGYWAASALPNNSDDDITLMIGEGAITVLSAKEITGLYGVAALSSSNLLSISKKMRQRYPKASLILLADLVKSTGEIDPNALKAAQAVDAKLAVPDFGDNRVFTDTDFNDMKRVCGVESVRQAILNAQQITVPSNQSFSISDKHKQGVEVICASDITPEPICWLWNGWLAAGKLHIFGGAPGTGKTTISMALAAIITNGGKWPDGSLTVAGKVVIWSGEDDPKDTLIPRLTQAGANLSRVYFITGILEDGKHRSFDPAIDMGPLRNKLFEINEVRLLIIDPIVSAITGDSHKNAEVRRGLQPLVDLAASMNFALLGITHLSKGTSGRDPVERLTGSLAFGALARIVMIAAKHENKNGAESNVRIFLRAKSNIGSDKDGFEYEIKQSELKDHPEIITSSVVWMNTIFGAAREILSKAETLNIDSKESVLSEATNYLAALLAKGPLSSELIKEQAKDAGYSTATIRRAKEALKIEAIKDGKKQWFWQLPFNDSLHQEDQMNELKVLKDNKHAQQNNVSTFGNLEHLLLEYKPVVTV